MLTPTSAYGRNAPAPGGAIGGSAPADVSKPFRAMRTAFFILVCAVLSFNPAAADPLQAGKAAFDARNYVRASEIFLELAALGDPKAQTYLGFMYFNGKGVPQNFIVSAAWYRCASQQGVPAAQYMLGLMYDKGQGVPQDYVIAYALLNLAVAGADPGERDNWARIRDAVASKLTLNERLRSQETAFAGTPQYPCLPIVTGY